MSDGGDKLVVGYSEFIEAVTRGLEIAGSDHSCQDQNSQRYLEMAKSLWASGYRFDATARAQWLVVEMRGRIASAAIAPDTGDLLNELLVLLGAGHL